MNATSRDWLIESNRLIQNKKAIRIAANQDHGIRGLSESMSSIPPHHHVIQNNEIRNNVIGIELENAIDTQMEQNTLDNFVANFEEK
jgi:hypothetical protein